MIISVCSLMIIWYTLLVKTFNKQNTNLQKPVDSSNSWCIANRLLIGVSVPKSAVMLIGTDKRVHGEQLKITLNGLTVTQVDSMKPLVFRMTRNYPGIYSGIIYVKKTCYRYIFCLMGNKMLGQ